MAKKASTPAPGQRPRHPWVPPWHRAAAGQTGTPGQPARNLDLSKLQPVVQKLAGYGRDVTSILERFADILQSKAAGAPPEGAGADFAGDSLQRAIDHHLASLVELLTLKDYYAWLDQYGDEEGGGEEEAGAAPKAGAPNAPTGQTPKTP